MVKCWLRFVPTTKWCAPIRVVGRVTTTARSRESGSCVFECVFECVCVWGGVLTSVSNSGDTVTIRSTEPVVVAAVVAVGLVESVEVPGT
jgi:hypothetical protein